MAREKAPMPAAAPASDKKRAIDTAMAQIEKMYGKGSIMRFGDNVELNVDYIPTGSLALDVALGIGQADSVLRLMRAQGFGDIQVVKDTGDIPRVVFGTLCTEV